MTSHVAFLRAINTGRRRITNGELADVARSLGFDEVDVYQASGNLLLSSNDASDVVAERLTDGLLAALGWEVPAIVRTSAEVRSTADADPFPGRRPLEGSKPQVIFLAERLADPAVLDDFSSVDDWLASCGSEIHWWPRAGMSTSELQVPQLERAVGTCTVRTLGSVRRIAARLG